MTGLYITKNKKIMLRDKWKDAFDFEDKNLCNSLNNLKVVRIIQEINSDVRGKVTPTSIGGANYFVTFIDDATIYTWVYFLKTKDEVFAKFVEWKTIVEKQFDKCVKIIRSDNGGEYTSTNFANYLRKEGIKQEFTMKKTPEQNGVAERMNRSLIESIRCMLSDSKLKKPFWAEALNTAVYVKNRSPATALKDQTPFEALFGYKPSVKHFIWMHLS